MLNDDDTAIIQPKRARWEEPLPPTGLMLFTAQDLNLVISYLSSAPQEMGSQYLSKVYRVSSEGNSFVVAGPMIGAPQATLVLEKLIAFGVRNFIALGWCGSLQSHIRIGDVVLPTGAVSEEGTSPHYSRENIQQPSSKLVSIIKEKIANSPLTVYQGSVWTTDAPYRETVCKVKRYQSQNILAVEMEASALFAVARFRKVDLAVILVASDELFSLKWKHGLKDERFRWARKTIARLALEMIAEI